MGPRKLGGVVVHITSREIRRLVPTHCGIPNNQIQRLIAAIRWRQRVRVPDVVKQRLLSSTKGSYTEVNSRLFDFR